MSYNKPFIILLYFHYIIVIITHKRKKGKFLETMNIPTAFIFIEYKHQQEDYLWRRRRQLHMNRKSQKVYRRGKWKKKNTITKEDYLKGRQLHMRKKTSEESYLICRQQHRKNKDRKKTWQEEDMKGRRHNRKKTWQEEDIKRQSRKMTS